jgi:hypothetical protein
MNSSRILVTGLGLVLLFSGTAFAYQGMFLTAGDLSAEALANVHSEVSKAQQNTPEAFDAVQRVVDRVAELDAAKRGRFAPMTSHFKQLGPDALWPMVAIIALTGPDTSQLEPSALTALRAGLLEAVGGIRDARVSAVLMAVMEKQDADPVVFQAAVGAVAKLGHDEAIQHLESSLGQASGETRLMILRGMGLCRRAVIAQRLADELEKTISERTARVLVHALSDVGNSGAWGTSVIQKSGEEASTRSLAATALVKAYVRFDGEVRQAASNGVMVVNHPASTAQIDLELSEADASQRVALEALQARIERGLMFRR